MRRSTAGLAKQEVGCSKMSVSIWRSSSGFEKDGVKAEKEENYGRADE